jgi:Gluconate 2-dehydrogenase subunit 3
MSETDYSGRFPGFDVMKQRRHWDDVTAEVVEERFEAPPGESAFTEHELTTTARLVTMLLDLDGAMAALVAAQIGRRLESGETDGWHYDDMPEDVIAWRRSLQALDEESRLRGDTTFDELDSNSRHRILTGVTDSAASTWHGMAGAKVWNMWLRYACTAFYAHPDSWNEIGFPGPAYPRGYKNPGVDKLEPFEVADAGPVIHLSRKTPSRRDSSDAGS